MTGMVSVVGRVQVTRKVSGKVRDIGVSAMVTGWVGMHRARIPGLAVNHK